MTVSPDNLTESDAGASASSGNDARLVLAVQEYLAELESGRRPNRSEYLRRNPAIADSLAQCLDGLELVHKATAGEKRPGSEPADRAGSGAELPANPLGDFQIVREIGRGGMGIVYEAMQLSLGRRVALKVLPFAATFDAKHLQRFHHEAQAAAQLHHTNIVPVYAVGCERGVHFYAMQLIDGQSLAAVIEQVRRLTGRDHAGHVGSDEPIRLAGQSLEQISESPPPRNVHAPTQVSLTLSTHRSGKNAEYFRMAARLIAQAADALEHAHQFGIVHRDIKPANLLVDVHGRIWITDFGLAQFHADAGLTETGDVLGTLRYMSPEQASGQRVLLDHRTDIYALGATLYELVTLEPIFPGRNRSELLHQILHAEPRAPRLLDKSVPRELETIVLKAVSKQPAERYETAKDLAADLQRFLEDKPILARRPSLLDRCRKWSRRHPGLVAASVFVLLLCVVGLLVNNWMIANEQAKTAKRADEAEARFQLARRAVDDMIRLANEEQANDLSQQNLRRRLLEGALAYYQEFIEQRREDPGAQAELEATRDRVRSILSDLVVLQGAWQHLLLRSPEVRSDLQLSSEQRAELDEVLQEVGNPSNRFRDFHRLSPEERAQRFLNEIKTHEQAIGRILTAKQLRRLRQIALQVRGPLAFNEPEVVDALRLTAKQRDQIRMVGAGPFHPGAPPPPGEPPSDLVGQILLLLGEQQVSEWNKLIGSPFAGSVWFPPPPHPHHRD